jgi:hypothetical protein
MSAFQSFSDAISNASTNILTGYVLPTVVNFYREKFSVETTVEDLMSVLKIQSTAFQPNLSIGLSAPISNIAPTSVGRKKATTTKQPDAPVPEGEGCIFRFQRETKNKKKGEICNDPRIPGSQYCKLCAYKKTGGGLTKGTKTGAAVPTGLTMTPIPIPNVSAGPDSITADDSIVPGYIVEESSNFVFEIVNDSEYYTFGKLNDSKTHISQLSTDDSVKASQLGMKTYESQSKIQTLLNSANEALALKNGGVSTQVSVNAPQVSGPLVMPQIPQIPQMPQLSGPLGPLGMPQIQSIPQIPGMPGIPGMPQMPQMQQLSGPLGSLGPLGMPQMQQLLGMPQFNIPNGPKV